MDKAETHVQLDVERAGKELREKDKTSMVNAYRTWVMIAGGVSLAIWFLVMWNYGWGEESNRNFTTTSTQTQSPENKAVIPQTQVEETRQQVEPGMAANEPPPERTEAADVRKDCGGDYAKLTNCRNVYFGRNEKYFIESAKGICPVADPSNAGIWKPLVGNQYNFIPFSDEGVKVTFFEMKVDETFGGYTCK